VAEAESDFTKVDRALTSAMLSSRHPTFNKVVPIAPSGDMQVEQYLTLPDFTKANTVRDIEIRFCGGKAFTFDEIR
jgi:hypothetical protein